uniref:Uncharacterized protein n=1 Tax=Poecilia mexicana TaxID=48701 RepID=A0A3B3YWA1_9TELE
MAEKKNCPEGKTWDHLLRTCIKMGPIPTRKLHPPTVKFTVFSSEPVLTVVDPLLKKSKRHETVRILHIYFYLGVAEDSVLEVLKKTEPAVKFHAPQLEENGQDLQRVSDGSCRPMHQPNPKCEDGFGVCRDDHRVPLPATELGGTALVTAKTV